MQSRDKSRIVFFGHASYHPEDKPCTVPPNVTVTLYAPPGALLAESICNALASGEDIMAEDIEPKRDEIYFFNKGLSRAENYRNLTHLDYPKTYYAGEQLPNFKIVPAEAKINPQPIRPIETEAFTVSEQMYLHDLLQLYPDSNIHWAACSFTFSPDQNAIGYGYAFQFKKSSIFRHTYAPALTEDVKLARRQERFGTIPPKNVVTNIDSELRAQPALLFRKRKNDQDPGSDLALQRDKRYTHRNSHK